MDATLKHSIQQRAIHVLRKELAEHGENLEAQKIYLDTVYITATKMLNAVNDKRWDSYDLPPRFTRDNG